MIRKPKTAEVTAMVAKHFNIRQTDILSRKRIIVYSRPRQILCYLLRKHRKDSFPKIGYYLDRDHTTILHNCRKIEMLMRLDSDVFDDVEAIEDQLNVSGYLTQPKPIIKPIFDFHADNLA